MRILFACLLLLTHLHCHPAKSGSALPTHHTMTIVTTTNVAIPITLERAETNASRAQGLMFRKHLDANHGMLFVFDSEGDHAFWMQNTYISLDMLFINTQQQIIGIIERAEPMSTEQRAIGAPSKYVLEVNGGFARRHGITLGATVTLPKNGP